MATQRNDFPGSDRRVTERSQVGGKEGLPAKDDRAKLIRALEASKEEVELQAISMRDAQASLERSLHMYFTLFNLAPVGILRLDEHLVIAEANRAALSKLGPRSRLLGRPFPLLVEESCQLACRHHFDSASYYERTSECEISLKLATDQLLKVRLYSTSLSATGRNSEGYLTALVDITRQQEDEDRIRLSAAKLQDMDSTVKVLINNRDQAAEDVKETVASNKAMLIDPVINRLKNSGLNKEQKVLLDILQESLDQLASGFSHRLTSPAYRLTTRELEVANLIRNGLTTDEMSELLNISVSGVVFHRNKIRSKLGLVGVKQRLAEKLHQLT